MNKDKYKSYNRIHKCSHPSEIEKEKIEKETNAFKKLNKRSKNLSRKLIRDFESIDDEYLDEYDSVSKEAIQQKRTAKGHKERLKELEKRDDFV